METESVKVKEADKLSGFEIELIVNLLNSRSQVGGGIKDLRLIEGTISRLKGSLLPKPLRPEIRPLKADEKEYPKEELEALQKQQEEWGKKFDEYLNSEVGCDLSDGSKLVIRQRLQNFQSFNTDEATRERILKLASKFGV